MNDFWSIFLSFILPSILALTVPLVVAINSNRLEKKKLYLQKHQAESSYDTEKDKTHLSAADQVNSMSLKWVSEFKQEMDEMKQELATMKLDNKEKETRLLQNEREIDKLKEENLKLNQENARLQKELNEVRKVSLDQAVRIQNLEEENRELRMK